MTRFHTDALEAAHTQRELDEIPQSDPREVSIGPDTAKVAAMEDANWKPAAQYWREQSETKQTRIEQLERELAAEKEHSKKAWSEHAKQIDMQMSATMRANSAEIELAAERALADRLYTELWSGRSWQYDELMTAYRKARGL